MKNLGKVLALLLLFSAGLYAEEATFLDFEKGIYERAKLKAAEEGKLLFMDFYAKWCTPCKWMDETTFSDPNIIKQLDEKYIAIKVDIDDMEGFELKSRFDIKYLPTMLIFNAEGKMVERIEETLSPSKMSAVLASHQRSTPINIKHDFNTSPSDVVGKDIAVEEEEDNMVLSQDEYRQYFASETASFRMQMGVYENYDGALKQVNELNEIFLEEIVVVEDVRGDRTLYKVIMGDFNSMNSAKSFQKTLKEKYKLDSIIY